MESERDERKSGAMSVSFFELAQAGFSGRAGRTGRVARPLPLSERILDHARPWQRYLGWALIGAGADRAVAIAMAAGAELPMAALCAYLAVRLHPQAGPQVERR